MRIHDVAAHHGQTAVAWIGLDPQGSAARTTRGRNSLFLDFLFGKERSEVARGEFASSPPGQASTPEFRKFAGDHGPGLALRVA